MSWPETQADVRYQYILDLWDRLEPLQRESDEEHEKFFEEHPEHIDNPTFQPRREFMNELFDRSEVECFSNVFRFWHPEPFVLDHRVLDLLGPHKPDDMCWGYPHVMSKNGRLCVEVMLIDRDGP